MRVGSRREEVRVVDKVANAQRGTHDDHFERRDGGAGGRAVGERAAVRHNAGEETDE